MIISIYTLQDAKSGRFMGPCKARSPSYVDQLQKAEIFRTKVGAIRSAVSNKSTYKHPTNINLDGMYYKPDWKIVTLTGDMSAEIEDIE